MPNYPLTCSCDRCYKLDADLPWTDSEHTSYDAQLNFCPQCGQQLKDIPTHHAPPREELHHDRP